MSCNTSDGNVIFMTLMKGATTLVLAISLITWSNVLSRKIQSRRKTWQSHWSKNDKTGHPMKLIACLVTSDSARRSKYFHGGTPSRCDAALGAHHIGCNSCWSVKCSLSVSTSKFSCSSRSYVPKSISHTVHDDAVPKLSIISSHTRAE